MTTFKAWSHSSPSFPDGLKLVDVTAPEELQPNAVLVEVVRAALNPVDVQLANMSLFRLAALSYPKALGCDFSGRVTAKGSGVADLEVGDEVFGLNFAALGKPIEGALSEIILVDRANIIKKPSSLSFADAASLPLVFHTAVTALSPPYTLHPPPSAELHKPTIVVLGGSSAVGIYTIQYALRRLNARVIATSSAAKSEFVRSLGAETTIDYAVESIPKRLAALRPSEGYLSIIDCVGGTELIPHLGDLLTPRSKPFPSGGAYVSIVGDKTDRYRMGGPPSYFFHPWMVVRHLKGYFGFGPRYATISYEAKRENLEEAVKLVEEGMKVVIDSEYEFKDVVNAYERLNSGRAQGKVVVEVRAE